jgi:hypothetical protein
MGKGSCEKREETGRVIRDVIMLTQMCSFIMQMHFF